MASTYPPLYCHRCLKETSDMPLASKVKATGSTQFLFPKGEKRLFSELICSKKHRWWSAHTQAHTLDRRRDEQLGSTPS